MYGKKLGKVVVIETLKRKKKKAKNSAEILKQMKVVLTKTVQEVL